MKRKHARAASLAVVVGTGLTLGVLGCSKKPIGDGKPAPATSASAPGQDTAAGSRASRGDVAFDVLEDLDACTLGYRGEVLDLGDASTRAAFGTRLDDARIETVEREGASWARIRTRSVAMTFVHAGDDPTAPDDGSPTFVEARVRAAGARAASVFLNGKPVGSWSFAHGETRVVVAKGGNGSLVKGTNELLLRFSASLPRGSDETLAEIDWVHVGTGEPETAYAAPTREGAVMSAAFDGTSKRALALRAPGFSRCTTFVPSGARVEAFIGLTGSGEGDAEIRLHRDRAAPVVLAKVHVSSSSPHWVAVSAPVGDLGPDGSLAMIELAALNAGRSTRILFGEPRLRTDVEGAPAPAPAVVDVPPARNAVFVVMGSLAANALALYGGSRVAPELTSLAARGAVFEAHRATTPFASGAFASMLTGVAAPTHGVIDADARLPTGITTLPDAVRQAGITTALFTANPTTSAAFGFSRGWDKFVVLPPANDLPGVRVFDEAARWVESLRGERFLLVVHARGAHPPWDATVDDMKTLPPPSYAGPIDPKHAAELLSTRSKKNPVKLSDADKTRLWALHGLAVDAHDAALGRLLAMLASTGHTQDTSVIVTSDIAANNSSSTPFAEGDPTDDPPLALPLVVALAGTPAPRGGARIKTPTAGLDLARTLVGALGLEPPGGFEGVDLTRLARGAPPPPVRPLLSAGNDRYVLRWGPFVLFGVRDRETKVCDTTLEAACLTDVQSTHPIALDALHRAAFDARIAGSGKRPREPATIDPATATALKAWGR